MHPFLQTSFFTIFLFLPIFTCRYFLFSYIIYCFKFILLDITFGDEYHNVTIFLFHAYLFHYSVVFNKIIACFLCWIFGVPRIL